MFPELGLKLGDRQRLWTSGQFCAIHEKVSSGQPLRNDSMKPITLRLKSAGIQAILNTTPHSYPEIALWRELSAQLGEHIAQLDKLEREPKRNEPADEALKADLRRRIADLRRRIADVRRIDAICDKEVDDSEEKRCKAAMLRVIRTRRQQLEREVTGKRCTDERRQEIQNELQDLKGFEHQECCTGEPPKHPSCRRPSARELGFETETPSADEILEAATIQRGLRFEKGHLIFAKLAEKNLARWGEVAKREATHDPKIERTRERIGYGDVRGISKGKCALVDRVIAENYFQSNIIKKPLRELSAEWASDELVKLGVNLSADTFDRALKRLALVR